MPVSHNLVPARALSERVGGRLREARTLLFFGTCRFKCKGLHTIRTGVQLNTPSEVQRAVEYVIPC